MNTIVKVLFFMGISSLSAYSQSFYFKTGKNFSNYNFSYSVVGSETTKVKLQSDSGTFYELGVATPFGTSRFSYELGVSLNELNSMVESPAKSVKYKTEYIGLDNAIVFSVIRSKRLVLDTKLGLGVETMIFGKQEIGGLLYDLKEFNEFNGFFIRPSLGTQLKFVASNELSFAVGCDYHYDVFNTKNTSNQSLLIHTGQVNFGMYYTMDKKREKKKKDTDTSKTSGIDVAPILNNNK
jgi:hypothetical protein